MVKNINFIEKKNKPIFDVELTMEYIIDKIYDNIIEYYKNINIHDIILIDKRFDVYRNKLIGCKLLNADNSLGSE